MKEIEPHPWQEPYGDSPFDRKTAYDALFARLEANPGHWMLVNPNASRSHPEIWTRRGCEVRRMAIYGSQPRRYRVYARVPRGN